MEVAAGLEALAPAASTGSSVAYPPALTALTEVLAAESQRGACLLEAVVLVERAVPAGGTGTLLPFDFGQGPQPLGGYVLEETEGALSLPACLEGEVLLRMRRVDRYRLRHRVPEEPQDPVLLDLVHMKPCAELANPLLRVCKCIRARESVCVYMGVCVCVRVCVRVWVWVSG